MIAPPSIKPPADYIHLLQTLADRYQQSYGIFWEKGRRRVGWHLLETVQPGKEYLITVNPKKGLPDATACGKRASI